MKMFARVIAFFCITFSLGNPLPKCDNPPAPYNCPAIVTYLRCLGRQVQDCKQNGQYVYWRVDNLLTWGDAHASCENVDRGNLVSIHDFDEESIVIALKEAKSMQTFTWSGLYCPGTCFNGYSDFVWSDSTPVDYNKFTSHNNGFDRTCAMMTKMNRDNDDYSDQQVWWSTDCNDQYISICKAKIQ